MKIYKELKKLFFFLGIKQRNNKQLTNLLTAILGFILP